MQDSPWKRSVVALIAAFCIYTLCGIAADIVEFVNNIKDGVSLLSILSGEEESMRLDLGDMAGYLLQALVIIGYLIFFSSLGQFARLQEAESDREQLLRVRTGYILLLLAAVADFIPVIGWIISLVLFIVGYVKLIGGYGRLKKSTTFSDPYNGAGLLRGASIWLLVGAILGAIPLIGGAFETILSIVAFFMTLTGWQRIKQGDPMPSDQYEYTPHERKKIVTWWSILLGWVILKFIFDLIPPDLLAVMGGIITTNILSLFTTLLLLVAYPMILRNDSGMNKTAKAGIWFIFSSTSLNLLFWIIGIIRDLYGVTWGTETTIQLYNFISLSQGLLSIFAWLLLFIGNPYNRLSRYIFLCMFITTIPLALGLPWIIIKSFDLVTVETINKAYSIIPLFMNIGLLVSIVLWSRTPKRIQHKQA